MEEINLDFQKNNHKDINLSGGLNSNVNDVNIFRSEEKKDSNIGIDLLINKSKSSGSSEPAKVEEFKPSDPVIFNEPPANRTPSPSINVTLDNNLSSNSNNIDSLDLNDLGINLDSSTSNNNLQIILHQ